MFYFYDLYWEINYDLIKLQTFMLSLHTVQLMNYKTGTVQILIRKEVHKQVKHTSATQGSDNLEGEYSPG